MDEPVSSVKALYNEDYILALRRVVLQGDKYIKLAQRTAAQLQRGEESPVLFVFEVCHQHTYICINPFLDAASQPVVFTGTIQVQELTKDQHVKDKAARQQVQLLREVEARALAGPSQLRLDDKLKRGAVVILSMASGLLTGRTSGRDVPLERWLLQSSLGLSYVETQQEKQLVNLENELRQDIARQAQQARDRGDNNEAELNLERATVAVHFEQLMQADPELARAITSPYMILVIQALGQLINGVYVKGQPDNMRRFVAQICIPEDSQSAQGLAEAGSGRCYPIDSKAEQLM